MGPAHVAGPMAPGIDMFEHDRCPHPLVWIYFFTHTIYFLEGKKRIIISKWLVDSRSCSFFCLIEYPKLCNCIVSYWMIQRVLSRKHGVPYFGFTLCTVMTNECIISLTGCSICS
ncbi:hypothetical protein GUJ93_ZPchr0001g31609 [Zizania palustris]|uniref:Uncharacterized protein n=1 Tax=Zizania palustris TaxID=103762 RepID=A0A8J5RMZ6_ZIZPA|nr:hypothetical protein GUJ93_ZPchr0001g31609 [Zizania palustris]